MAKHASSCSSALICVLVLFLPLVRPANLNCCGAHGPVSGSRTWRLARACMPRGLGLCTGCNELADFIAIADHPDIRRHSNPLISIMNCRSHRWPTPPAQALPSGCPPAAVTGGFYVRAPARGTRVPDLTCVLSLSKVYSLSFRLWSFWVVRTEELETRIPQLNPPVDWMMPQCTDCSHMSTTSSSSSSTSSSSSSSSSSTSSCSTSTSYISNSTWWRSPIHGT